MSNVLVIGSTNIDMVVTTSRFPKEGETILGGQFISTHGGKGANQAVAAARLGANVTFATKVGNDIFGAEAKSHFSKEGINPTLFFTDATEATGVALITVNAQGENNIVVASGANMTLSADDLADIDKHIHLADVVLIQLEIPMAIVELVAEKAKKFGKKVILNPAPATQLSDKLLDGLYLITPNQSEAEILIGKEITDEDPLRRSADLLRLKGVQNVIFTLGEKGAYLSTPSMNKQYETPRVKVKDTTAAGDVFNGALATAIAKSHNWDAIVEFAIKAASISVTKLGAQASAPTLSEVENFS
jgi:ribokinase